MREGIVLTADDERAFPLDGLDQAPVPQLAHRAAGGHPGASVFLDDAVEGGDPLGVDAAGDLARDVVRDLGIDQPRAVRIVARAVTLSHALDDRAPLTSTDARGRLHIARAGYRRLQHAGTAG